MPAVRNLTTPATTVEPKADAAPLVPDAKPNGTLAMLPAWATAVPAVPSEMPSGLKSIYIAQLQPNTGKRQSLLAAGVQDGQYYIDDGVMVLPLAPFRFFLLAAEVFRTDMDSSGNIIAATRNMEDRNLAEHVVAHVVAIRGGVCLPAKVEFRKAQYNAGKVAIEGAKLAASPDFPSKSEAAKVAAAFPVPFGRMVTSVTVLQRIAKSGKNAGKPYYASEGSCQPASVNEMQALAKALEDESFVKQLESTRSSYEYRVKQLVAIVK